MGGEGEEEEGGDDKINYFYFVVTQPRHFVLHIPNTPPHHHLCSRKTKINTRIPFIPPPLPLNLNKKTNKKKSPYSNEKLKKKKPSALFVCPAPEKGRKLQEGDQLRENQKNMTTLY